MNDCLLAHDTTLAIEAVVSRHMLALERKLSLHNAKQDCASEEEEDEDEKQAKARERGEISHAYPLPAHPPEDQ